MLLDTHVHLIYRDELDYPWLDNEPALNRDATYDDYLRQARQLGITRALHMEVDVAEVDMERETDMIERLMAREDSILVGAIAACRPENKDFPAFLERQLERACVKGFRRVLHVVADDVSTTSTFRDNVDRLAEADLPFDLCFAARQLPLAIELVDACPKVRFVLDHCGVPDIANDAWQPWADHMRDISRRDNVNAKISGVMAYGDGRQWTLSNTRRYVEHTIDSFGWDRIVWGSDSPVCTLGGEIGTWVAALHTIVDGASAAEKDRLFQVNAKRIWKL